MNTHEVRYGYNKIAEAMGMVFSYQFPDTDNQSIPRDILAILDANESIQFMCKANDRRYYFMAYEILTDVLERENVEQFLKEYEATSIYQKRCWFLNYYFPIRVIEEVGNDMTRLRSVVSEHLPDDPQVFLKYLEKPETFFDSLVKDILVIAESEALATYLNATDEEVLKRKLEACKLELSMRHPLSYAQSMMGKSFYNIADWNLYEFYFVKSLYPYILRVSNHQTNIQLTSIHRREAIDPEWEEAIKRKMKVISDPKRMAILRMIYANPMFGKEIAEKLSLTTATVSHHLEIMRQEGLINEERDKNTKYFSTNTLAFERLLQAVDKYIRKN